MKQSVASRSLNGKPEISDPLIASYDDLNALWKKAEEELAAMRLPVSETVPVSSSISEDNRWEWSTSLGWCKYQNDWRLCLIEAETDTIGEEDGSSKAKPVMECPMEDRIRLAPFFVLLKRLMRQARENYIPQVGKAISALKAGLEE